MLQKKTQLPSIARLHLHKHLFCFSVDVLCCFRCTVSSGELMNFNSIIIDAEYDMIYDISAFILKTSILPVWTCEVGLYSCSCGRSYFISFHLNKSSFCMDCVRACMKTVPISTYCRGNNFLTSSGCYLNDASLMPLAFSQPGCVYAVE